MNIEIWGKAHLKEKKTPIEISLPLVFFFVISSIDKDINQLMKMRSWVGKIQEVLLIKYYFLNYLLFIEGNRNRKQTWDSIKRAEETKSSSIAPLTIGGGSSDVDDVENAEKSSFPATLRSTRFPGWFISTSGNATYMVPAMRRIWILFELSARLHKLHESDHKGVDIMSEACNSLVSNWHSSITTCNGLCC